MQGIKHSLDDAAISGLARAAHGFVGADLALLVKEACFHALRRCLTLESGNLDDIWVGSLFQDCANSKHHIGF